MAVEITQTALDAVGLRRAAAQSRDADAARRMLALALVLDGHARASRHAMRDGSANTARRGASLQ